MTRPVLTLLTALALLLQAMIGLSPARAMASSGPVAFCHSGSGSEPAPIDQPDSHDCLACPVCAAAVTPPPLIPPAMELPRSGRVTIVVSSLPASPAPSQVRAPANLPTGPPRLI